MAIAAPLWVSFRDLQSAPDPNRQWDMWLAGILPPSIERLYLIDYPIDAVANILGIDTAHRRGRFPNLKEVAVVSTQAVKSGSGPGLEAAMTRLAYTKMDWETRGGPKLYTTAESVVPIAFWH